MLDTNTSDGKFLTENLILFIREDSEAIDRQKFEIIDIFDSCKH